MEPIELILIVYGLLLPLRLFIVASLAFCVGYMLYMDKQTHRENKITALILIFSIIDLIACLYILFAGVSQVPEAEVALLMRISSIGLFLMLIAGYRLYQSKKKNDPFYPNDMIYKLTDM